MNRTRTPQFFLPTRQDWINETSGISGRPQVGVSVLAPTAPPRQKNASTVACSVPAQADFPAGTRAQLHPTASGNGPSDATPSVASFASIKDDTTDQFNALYATGQNSVTSRLGRKERTTKQQRAELRAWRNTPTGGQCFSISPPAAYAAAKNNRPDSLMEQLLPPDGGLRQKLDPFSGAFRDPATGLYVELKQLPNNNGKPSYALCITGTGRGEATRAQLATNLLNFIGFGGVPPAYRQAAMLAAALQKKFAAEGGELCLVGHSLGGGIANYAGLKTNLHATCYNPAALGGACLNDLEKTGCLNADTQAKQKIVRIKGDPVSSERVQQALVSFLSISTYFHIRLPCSIGQVYEIPKNKSSNFFTAIDTHRLRVFGPAYKVADEGN
jgi:hypothetical protein